MAGPLILFGTAHVSSVLLIAAIGITLPLLARRGLSLTGQYRIGLLIAALLIAQEGVHIWLQVNHYDRLLSSLLPLHLCGLSVLLTAWTLAARSYSAYEIVYFWAWGGTLQALFTPDLDRGFPDPAFIAFFVGHGLVIVGVLYATLVYRFRPRLASIFKSLGVLLVVVAVVAPINLWLGTNYLFLCSKPEQASLMDFLGPWPWYILSLAGLALVSSFFYYLPFLIGDLVAARSRAKRLSPPSPDA
ncbi:YwaF family protein [Thiocapsa bogorovii]|uniref:YwaF family protein n=1 Tax=Thiocapsa bogorovii TaxID=521689 RepID=UPI001E536793|nr:TIGR02206 family membrane protein [Thiocapsa bogorovii]UHD15759.1 TIGR02206 family membrane protein [Thiocapsa bogorovii]